MGDQRFPAGWHDRRVREVLAELRAWTGDESVAADEAAAESEGQHGLYQAAVPIDTIYRRFLL
jgi:hypothetical protein